MIEPCQESRSQERGHFLADLRETFAAQASRPAIVYKDASWTFGDLDAKARHCAGRLRQLGVEAGDRVAIITSEKLPFLAAHLGTLYAGAVSLPLESAVHRRGAAVLPPGQRRRVVVAGERSKPVIESLRAELPELRGLLSDAEAWDAPDTAFSEPSIDRDAPCLMLYSSGTTGRPKGVVHTHANLASSLRALASVLAIHARRRAGQRPAPVSHPWALIRHAPEPLDRMLHAHGGFVPSATDPGRRGTGNGLHGDPDVLLQLSRAARIQRGRAAVARRPALHLRLGADPARGAARSWRKRSGPARHQPLRDDRGARHHELAARRPLAAGLGRRAARRHRGAGRRGRRHARGRRRGRLGAAPRPEPVPRVLAQARCHPRGVRFGLVRHRRPGLSRREPGS